LICVFLEEAIGICKVFQDYLIFALLIVLAPGLREIFHEEDVKGVQVLVHDPPRVDELDREQ